MKEAYFRADTLEPLSDHWLDLYGNPRQNNRQPFLVQEAALLILDMQEYFLEESSHAYVPSGKTIIPGLNRVIGYFREFNRPVIFTQHINSEANAGKMASWWSELIRPEHSQANIHPDLDFRENEILVKSQYDAFFRSDLKHVLTESSSRQLVICGVMSHLCCETTARSAFVQGFDVFFPIDGSASYNSEFHQATLQNLGHGFAVLTKLSRLLEGKA